VIDLSYRDSDHTYWHGDRELAGVTSILEATGIAPQFYRNLGPEYRQRGTAGHLAVFYVALGEYDEDSTHPAIRPFARQFMAFQEDTGFRPMIMECAYANVNLGIAGRLDMAGLDRHEEPSIVDLKTGSLPPDIYVATQLAGYDHLLTEGVRIPSPDSDNLTLNWAEKLIRDNPKLRFKRKCLHLPGGDAPRGTLKSFDQPKWASVWRSCITNYNARKEAGLL
jgi:hypothetical protein